ncbi:hypothetical protein KBC55_01805 [Patescibacteria group bacterium]|nr:hypothetical protein [Patescibacteria group bacterium]
MSSSPALLPVASDKSGDEQSGVTTLDFLLSIDGTSAGVRRRYEKEGFGSIVTTWTGSLEEFSRAFLTAVNVDTKEVHIILQRCTSQYKPGTIEGRRMVGEATFIMSNRMFNEVYDRVCPPPEVAH